jgi:hypothetical protein
MNSNQKMQVRAHVRFSPSCTLVVQLEIECSPDQVVKLFLKDFSYSLDVEKENSWQNSPAAHRFVIRENRTESILWSSENPRQVLDILGSISEQGFFNEEILIRSDDREYSRSSNQDISPSIRNNFRRIIEEIVSQA